MEVYDCGVYGKSAIEWIVKRCPVTRDKDSTNVNDLNNCCREHHNPRYIVDLIKRVVCVSLETMQIVQNLPALNEDK